MPQELIDISQSLHPGIPVWPGTQPFAQQSSWQLGPDCPVNVSNFSMNLHCGTHADSHFHFDKTGATTEDMSLSAYLGLCQVIDVRHSKAVIQPGDFKSKLKNNIPRVLFRTYEHFPHQQWDPDFTPVAAESITLLGEHGVALIGVDSASIDPMTSQDMSAHKEVKKYQMAILEGLVLEHVPAGLYELIALPIPLKGLDAAPVRAVLRTLPDA